MMKKNGFTLAEVLITLMVIGVVAMMTLPALMTNVQEQQARTGLKKGFNTLSEAAEMNMAIEGFNYGDIETESASDLAEVGREQSLRGLLTNRTQIDPNLSRILSSDSVPDALSDTKVAGSTADRMIFFRDGSAVYYNAANTVKTDTNSRHLDDGLPLGFTIIYDTNGIKGPNMVSNCAGSGTNDDGKDGWASGSNPVDGTYNGTTINCDDKSKRIIKDQFLLQLRGSSVSAGGAAAKYVLER